MKIKISEIEHDPPRESHTEASIRQRAADMKKHGLINPLTVSKVGGKVRLVAGMGRLLSAKLLGWQEIDVRVIEGPVTVSDLKVVTLCENLHRTDLSGWEKYESLSELMCMNQDWQLKDLAEAVSLDPSMVTRILSPSKCSPEWQDALKAGKVNISDCYAAYKQPLNEQSGLLALKLSGASRDQLENIGRKKRAKPSVKLAKVKIALPNKVSVTLSGGSLGILEVVDVLNEALREAKKASLQYDVKTFQSMMRDKAKR